MSLAERIDKDLITALKAKEELKLGTLRFLKSALKNYAIDKRLEKLEDKDVLQIIQKQMKQRQDSIEAYKKGGRDALAQKEENELEVLKSYMPEQLSEDELRKIVLEVIEEMSASSPKDMGKVMGAVMPKVAGKAESRVISQMVKEELNKSSM